MTATADQPVTILTAVPETRHRIDYSRFLTGELHGHRLIDHTIRTGVAPCPMCGTAMGTEPDDHCPNTECDHVVAEPDAVSA